MIVVVYVGSAFWSVSYTRSSWRVAIQMGGISYFSAPTNFPWAPSGIEWKQLRPFRVSLGEVLISLLGGWRTPAVRLPLEIPLFVAGLVTAFLWWVDRTRFRPGHCRSCDYDLTGNVSGRCPECGTAIPE